MCEMDPDLQYFSNPSYATNSKCDYHLEETFNNILTKKKIDGLGISLISHNIRSIDKHDTEFRVFLDSLDLQLEIIGICESWL